MRFDGLPRRELRTAFVDAVASALDGRDLSLDSGFGPDTEQALIDLAFVRADAGQDLIEKVHGTFCSELAAWPDAVPSYRDVARLVLTRMAHSSLLEWHAAHEDPPDHDAVHNHRYQRSTWLALLAALDSDHLDIGELRSTINRRVVELPPPAVLESSTLAEIFDHDIIPDIFRALSPRDEPNAVLLCRSSAHPLSALRFASRRNCAVVDPDLLTAYHPRAAASVDAGVLHDALLWSVMAIRYAVERRLDVVVQTAADVPQQTADVAALFAGSGYQVVVHSVGDESVLSLMHVGGDL